MEFSRSVADLIRLRRSTRSYDSAEIGPDHKKKIIAYIKKSHKTVFGCKPGFGFIDASGMEKEDLRNLGTYGLINGARYFIGGTIKNNSPGSKNYCFIDFGYVFEKIILFLTDMELGTCWLGGTFNKKGFSQRLEPGRDEIIPAVSPVGIVFKKKGLRDSIIRKLVRSKYRKSWNRVFFNEDFSNPLSEVDSGPYREPLEMVRLAPSASNLQPWRIVKKKDRNIFYFFIQRTRYYQRGSGRVDMQFIDMGIALCHFGLAAEEMGLAGRWKIEKDIFSGEDHDPASKREYLVSWIGKEDAK